MGDEFDEEERPTSPDTPSAISEQSMLKRYQSAVIADGVLKLERQLTVDEEAALRSIQSYQMLEAWDMTFTLGTKERAEEEIRTWTENYLAKR